MTGALFDLDGVLIDTETLYTRFWAEIGKTYRLPSPTFALDIKGSTLANILDTYFPDAGIQNEIRKLIHDFEDTMQYVLFPGVSEFLDNLRANGIKTAIVTSSDDVKMAYLFKQHPGFRDRFDAVVNGSMVKRSKPDPEGYLTAAEAIGCDIRDCCVFEDSFQGLEAGMRSGAKVIALATTNSREKLKGKAHEIIDGFTGYGFSDF